VESAEKQRSTGAKGSRQLPATLALLAVDTHVRVVFLLAILLCPILISSEAGAQQSCAYLGMGSAVSVLDTASNTFSGDIPVVGVGRMAVTADGSTIYVAGGSTGIVSAISTATNIATDIRIGDDISVAGVAVTPDGQYLYVSCSAAGGSAVVVVDTQTKSATAVIPINAYGRLDIAIGASGARAYVASDYGSVVVIDTASKTVTKTIPFTGVILHALVAAPNGSAVYVAHSIDSYTGHTVSIIDTSTGTVTKSIGVSGQISDLAIRPDATEVYAISPCSDGLCNTAGKMTIINATSRAVSGMITMYHPFVAALTPDGVRAYVVQATPDLLSVVDLSSRRVTSDTLLPHVGYIVIASVPTGCTVPSPPPTRTRTATRTWTETRTPTSTLTITLTPTETPTPTITRTFTQTWTPTQTPTLPPSGPIALTSITLFTADASGNALSNRWNTQHDSVWVLGVQRSDLFGFFASDYLNDTHSTSSCFTCVYDSIQHDEALVLLAEPASSSLWEADTYFGVNLFFDGSTTPGISAFGNYYTYQPIPDSSMQTGGATGTGMVPGVGRLTYTAPSGDTVTLTGFDPYPPGDYAQFRQLPAINRVGSGEQFGASGAEDGAVLVELAYAARQFELSSPANQGLCRGTCAFDWQTASGDAQKYILYVDGEIRKNNLTNSKYTLTTEESLTDGTHFWQVAACNSTGDCSRKTSTWSFTSDGAPPEPFELLAPADNAWVSLIDGVVFQWVPTSDTGSGLDSYKLEIDGGVPTQYGSQLGTRPPQTSLQVTVVDNSALRDGPHHWRARAIDKAGNVQRSAERTINMDSTSPQLASVPVGPTNGTWVNDSIPALRWVLPTDEGSGIVSQRVTVDPSATSPVQADVAVETDTFMVPLNRALSDGLHEWQVRATDLAGNTATSALYHFGVDTSGPTGLRLTASPQGTADGAYVQFPTPPLCWVMPIDAGSGLQEFQLYIDGALNKDLGLGATCTTPLVALGEGRHEWHVVAVDQLGNLSVSETWALIYDATPPSSFSPIAPLDGEKVASPMPTFSWAASSDASGLARYELWVDGTCASPCSVPADATSSDIERFLGIGPHSWYVRAADLAGRTTVSNGGISWKFDVVASPTPTVTHTPPPTATPSATTTEAATRTFTDTPTTTPSRTPSETATATTTATPTMARPPTAAMTPTPTPKRTPVPTATGTPTRTATPTFRAPATLTPSATPSVTGTLTPRATATNTPPPNPVPTDTSTPTATATPLCLGDCNGSGEVTVDEIVKGVNIALGQSPVEGCSALDRNRDQLVTIEELIAAVQNALSGCTRPPTPTVTPRPPPTATRTVGHNPLSITAFDCRGKFGSTITIIKGGIEWTDSSGHWGNWALSS
jgi:DNA-binding beta-propeller fold protein YncE